MMYNSKLVASVKCNGKIMREHGETVYLPFGSEFSLLLKNLNSRKALVNISIDGQDVVPSGLIIGANETIDLERFIVNGNMSDGPRFKFIEKTEQISNHRGDKVEDGIVRISYRYEMMHQPYGGWVPSVWNSPSVRNDIYYLGNMRVGSSVDSVNQEVKSSGSITTNAVVSTYTSQVLSANDAGITTHGSQSNQKFQHGSIGALEGAEYVIVLQLKGEVGQHKVQRPVTVKRQLKCNVCGRTNKSSAKFCSDCGSNLTYQF